MSDFINCPQCRATITRMEKVNHVCGIRSEPRKAPKPAPAADPQTDEELAWNKACALADGIYSCGSMEEILSALHQAFTIGKELGDQKSASSAQGEEEAPLNKDAIFASSTFARPYLDGICQQTPFDVAKHSHYCGYIEGMRIGAEREKAKWEKKNE